MDNTLIIEHLRTRISEIKCSLPAHSIPPAMLIELEELEEQLEDLLREIEVDNDAAA